MLAAVVNAQDTRGSIAGRITDSTEAIIAGAEISAASKATGVVLNTVSNEQGNYRFDFLNPGTYELTVTTSGFKTLSREVELRTGDRLMLDLALEVGDLTERVTVTAETPLLETTNADRGQVIDNRRISMLPLAQGNPSFLLMIAPGANSGSSSNQFKFDEPGFEVVGNFSFHGAPRGTMGFTLNGIANNLSRTGSGQAGNSQPPAEAVEEFKISQSYDATQGHNSGTSVDVTLKSGSQNLHGTGYGFLRDSQFDAMTFLDNRAGNPQPQAEYRRVGFSINGPVYIPKFYPQRDKTFFAYTYEDTHQATVELAGTKTIPTPDQLKGDFSRLLGLGSTYQIYDPMSGTPTSDGFIQRTPFANNIIPTNRINTISQELSQYWPQPNLPGGRDGSANYQPGLAVPTDWYQSFLRLDHTFNEKHRMFLQHGILDHLGQWKDDFGTLATGFRENLRRQSFGVDYVYVARPDLLFNFRVGVTRLAHAQWHKSHVVDASGGFDISTLGLAPELIAQLDPANSSLPHIFIAGYNGIHDDTRRARNGVDVSTAEISAQHSRGNHSTSYGFEFRASRNNLANLTFLNPRYDFGTTYTNGPLNSSPAAPIGQGLAAFLLGQPSGGSIQRKDSFAAYNPDYSFFIQDNWRVTPKLTLNLGVRFENYRPVTERYNRSVREFDFAATSPIAAQARANFEKNPVPGIPASHFDLRGGYVFAGVNGEPRELTDDTGNLLAPRFGFAYRATDNTVVRGGYGIYFVPTGLTSNVNFFPLQAGFNRTTDLIPSVDNGDNFIADIRNPFPNRILAPSQASNGLATDLGQNVSFFNTNNLKAPYMQRWSMTVQQMLPSDTLVEIGYVGSRGTKLIIPRNLNFLSAAYLSKSPVRDEATIRTLSASYANPMFGLLPGSALNTRVIALDQLLRPFPQFRNVVLGQDNQAYAWYHAMEAKLEKRFSKGHSYIVSYTWSKNMEATSRLNDSDPMLHETIAPVDRTHILSITGIWELPFGKGRRFGASSPAVLSQIISGWDVSAVWQAQGGFPLTFAGDIFVTSDLSSLVLPESDRTAERWFNTDAGFVRAANAQPLFHERTFPLRFSTLRSDGLNTWDISIVKNNNIAERVNLQLYLQFLNAFNHPSFGAVTTAPSSGSFGRVTEEFTWARRVMFGLRVSF
jgi:hypothetical protein